MIKTIGNVRLDYSYYSDADSYSDGSIEDELLDYVKNEKDVLTILRNDNRWPILYHLSPVRQNILEWYDFDKNEECLEVGAGCGAITGVIARKVKHVDCVDLSERRCLINAHRNSEYDNICIYVANFNNLDLKKKYKYITLIGVLEYAAYYTQSSDPFTDFLRKLKTMLMPGGKLLIAIENKYGIKYWSGRTEDHTGRFFDSIIGYKGVQSKVRTFSRKRLDMMLRDSGFSNNNFYYPVPDYKFPVQIFSDRNLPTSSSVAFESVTYDNRALDLFDENAAIYEIIQDGMFPFFANSFFVEAGE